MNKNNIAIAGLGTVGSSLINYLRNNKTKLEKNINCNLSICGISAKDKNKKRSFSVSDFKWFNDPLEMIKHTRPDIFIELIGNEKGLSYELIKYALDNKINVITANKALLANYGNELFSLADNNNVRLLFEGAVCGGIPIIKTIKESLIGNNFLKISGILNGTTNYILSNMTNKNISFEEALNDAKNNGYVESNPDLDIEGIDSAHKLSIISSLCFGSKFIEFNTIYKEGISKIEKIDIYFANKLNFVIKLLSIAEIKDNDLNLYVRPMMIDNKSQLAQVSGVLNGIQIITKELDKIFLEGKGAGGMATTSSIISDVCEICTKPYSPSFGNTFNLLPLKNIVSINEKFAYFYIRLMVEDKPGVLAEITSLLKNFDISIESLIQDPLYQRKKNEIVPLVITTHKTYFKNVMQSVKEINNLKYIEDKPVIIQIDKV